MKGLVPFFGVSQRTQVIRMLRMLLIKSDDYQRNPLHLLYELDIVHKPYLVGAATDVRVPELVELDEAERGDGVHEGGVELEILVCGADVVGSAEQALHNHGQAHGVKDAEVLRDSKLAGTPRF